MSQKLLTAGECAAYLDALKDGLGVKAARERVNVPRSAVVNTCAANPEFAALCDEAKATRAAALLELAETATIDAATSDSTAKASIAKSLTAAAAQLAEKLAPREYGQLVKLGADPDSGPAIVHVVSYARPLEVPSAPEPVALEAHNIPTHE